MNKHSKVSSKSKAQSEASARARGTAKRPESDARRAIGIDLGDRYSEICVLDEAGEIESQTRIRTTPAPKFTAKRIGVILRDQYDVSSAISASQLRKFVALRRRELTPKEAFVRAQKRAHAQIWLG